MNRYGKLLLRVLGLLLLVMAAALAWHNISDARLAETASANIRQTLVKQTTQQVIASEDGEMAVETVDGVDYIATLEISQVSLSLPVAAEYDFDQLSQTPARYSGSYYTKDLVICAHNYPAHFEPLNRLDLGEEVLLKTVTGQVYRYRITNRQTIEPTAVEQVFKDTASDTDWDLSLFTCTPDGLARVLVRCSLVEKL